MLSTYRVYAAATVSMCRKMQHFYAFYMGEYSLLAITLLGNNICKRMTFYHSIVPLTFKSWLDVKLAYNVSVTLIIVHKKVAF